jgi:hypothetical protein
MTVSYTLGFSIYIWFISHLIYIVHTQFSTAWRVQIFQRTCHIYWYVALYFTLLCAIHLSRSSWHSLSSFVWVFVYLLVLPFVFPMISLIFHPAYISEPPALWIWLWFRKLTAFRFSYFSHLAKFSSCHTQYMLLYASVLTNTDKLVALTEPSDVYCNLWKNGLWIQCAHNLSW